MWLYWANGKSVRSDPYRGRLFLVQTSMWASRRLYLRMTEMKGNKLELPGRKWKRTATLHGFPRPEICKHQILERSRDNLPPVTGIISPVKSTFHQPEP